MSKTKAIKNDGDLLVTRRDVERVIKNMTFATVAAIQELDRRVAALEVLTTEPTVAAVETDTGEGDGLFL
jgi:uncharacterized protein YerC